MYRGGKKKCKHFALVKHCFHVVLRVFNGFLSLAHLQPKEGVSLHAALVWYSSHINTATIKQLTVLG